MWKWLVNGKYAKKPASYPGPTWRSVAMRRTWMGNDYIIRSEIQLSAENIYNIYNIWDEARGMIIKVA